MQKAALFKRPFLLVAGSEEISNFLQGYFEVVKLHRFLKGEYA
jgi:hypothetical protein